MQQINFADTNYVISLQTPTQSDILASIRTRVINTQATMFKW